MSLHICSQSKGEQLLLTMSKNQSKHSQLDRTLTKINCQPDGLMKRFTTTFPGTGATVDVSFSLVPRVHNPSTISKRFSRLLLQNKVKKVTLELLSQSCTVVTWRYLEEWGLLQLSLLIFFFAPKELMYQRGRYVTSLADIPTSIQQAGFPELVWNWLCVESLLSSPLGKHCTSPDRHYEPTGE